MTVPLLSLLILLPLVGAIALAFVPEEQKSAHRVVSASVALLVFVLSLGLFRGMDPTIAGFQWVESAEWIPSLGAGWARAHVIAQTGASPHLLGQLFGISKP